MDQLEVPQIPDKTWRQVFEGLQEFKSSKPWDVISDSDLFGLICPRTNQLSFGCIMGNAGILTGMFVYRGRVGYASFVAIQNGIEIENEVENSFAQDGILVDFTSKEFMDESDLAIFSRLGLKFRGRKSWPLLRSMQPGYIPWYLDENDADILLSALEVVPLVRKEVDKDPYFAHGRDGDFLPLYSFSENNWNYEWVHKSKYLELEEDEFNSHHFDELAIARILKRCLQRNGCWEASCFIVPEPMVDERGRPFFPLAAGVIEANTGHAFSLVMENPEINPVMAVQKQLLKACEKAGYLPEIVRVNDPHLMEGLTPFAKQLGFDLEVRKFERFDEFRAGAIQCLQER